MIISLDSKILLSSLSARKRQLPCHHTGPASLHFLQELELLFLTFPLRQEDSAAFVKSRSKLLLEMIFPRLVFLAELHNIDIDIIEIGCGF